MLAKKDIYNKKQKLRHLTLYNTPELYISKFFILFKDKISIFLQRLMKKVISLLELGFIKYKTCQTKAIII